MAIKVEVPFSKSIVSGKDLKSTFAYFADFESSIKKNFPGVESLTSVGPQTYHWRFQKFEHSGYGIQIEFITKFQLTEDKAIQIQPVPKPGLSQLSGNWKFEPSGQGTRVDFEARLDIELPLPFFLKAVAVPLAQKEITKLFERYTSNVGKTLTA